MQSITLTQETHKIPPTVYMVQNDPGRMLRMVIADNSYESEDIGSASVAIKRSDGSYYSIPATFDSDTDNTFIIDPRQALTQPGITECQLKITDDDSFVISTYTFNIMVQPSTDGLSEEQLGISVDDLMDAVERIMSGSLGQPQVISYAAEMTDTNVIYLYLGSEQGYENGDVYAYVSGNWTDTGIYGQGEQGEAGEDGFSPAVAVADVDEGREKGNQNNE